MGTGESSGDRRAIEAAEAAISNPLLDDVSMKGASGLLVSITGGNDLTLYEVDEAAEPHPRGSRPGRQYHRRRDLRRRARRLDPRLGGGDRARHLAADRSAHRDRESLTQRLAGLASMPAPARAPAPAPAPCRCRLRQPGSSLPSLPASRPKRRTRRKSGARRRATSPSNGGRRNWRQARCRRRLSRNGRCLRYRISFLRLRRWRSAQCGACRMSRSFRCRCRTSSRPAAGAAPAPGLAEQKKKVGFLERLTGVARHRKDEGAAVPEKREPEFTAPKPVP